MRLQACYTIEERPDVGSCYKSHSSSILRKGKEVTINRSRRVMERKVREAGLLDRHMKDHYLIIGCANWYENYPD